MAQGLAEAYQRVKILHDQIQKSIFGQEQLIDEAMACLLAGGHLIMTGAPGLAKTTLVRVFAHRLGLAFGRVQFTPDLLPSDIVGSEILHLDGQSGRRGFEFAPGPIFVHLLLADEINRASPRTQSALLEAMQEKTVTVAGTSHKLPRPFMVFATQNPFESEGTFPLPEAQLDRFLLHSLVQYPSVEAEKSILHEHALGQLVGESPLVASESLLSEGELVELQTLVRSVQVPDPLIDVIRDLVRSSRPEDETCPSHLKPMIWYGAGPRAGLCMVSAARSIAFLQGSEVVRWSHIERIVKPVMRHRVRLSTKGLREGLNEDKIITELVNQMLEKSKFLAKGA